MRRLKRLLSLCLLPLLAAGLFSFGWAQPADAARGGRIGGGSFRSAPIRSAPMRGGYGGDIELNEAASLSAQLNRQSTSLMVDAQRGNSSAADAELVDDATTAASNADGDADADNYFKPNEAALEAAQLNATAQADVEIEKV